MIGLTSIVHAVCKGSQKAQVGLTKNRIFRANAKVNLRFNVDISTSQRRARLPRTPPVIGPGCPFCHGVSDHWACYACHFKAVAVGCFSCMNFSRCTVIMIASYHQRVLKEETDQISCSRTESSKCGIFFLIQNTRHVWMTVALHGILNKSENKHRFILMTNG